jgi:cytochrome c oxidase subunit II
MIHIHTYEKWWMGLTIVMLVVLTTLIGLTAFANGFQVPEPWGRVDPKTVKDSGAFASANLGLHQLAPGKYEAYLLAQSSPWRFYPSELTIPVGSTVTFYVTSADVQHGFRVQDTNINLQILPGQISKATHTFDKAGEYPYICGEYCGVGHQTMYGKLTVK